MATNREPKPKPFSPCIQTLIRGRRRGADWGGAFGGPDECFTIRPLTGGGGAVGTSYDGARGAVPPAHQGEGAAQVLASGGPLAHRVAHSSTEASEEIHLGQCPPPTSVVELEL